MFLPNPEGKSVGDRWTAVQRSQSCGNLAPEEVGTGTRPGHRPLILLASAAELQKSSMTRLPAPRRLPGGARLQLQTIRIFDRQDLPGVDPA
jgi:hypothetical protein